MNDTQRGWPGSPSLSILKTWAALILLSPFVEAFGFAFLRTCDIPNRVHACRAPFDGIEAHDRSWITRKTRRADFTITCGSSQRSDSDSLMQLPGDRPLELWLDARRKGVNADALQKYQLLADAVVVDETQVDHTEQLPGSSAKSRLVITGEGKLVDGEGKLVGASVTIASPRDQDKAVSLIGSVEWVQVTCSDWTMIPAENLVSAAGGSPTRIAVELSESSQVQGAAFALQRGVDALLLYPNNNDLWTAAVDAREQRSRRVESCTAGGSSAPSLSSSTSGFGDDDVALSSGSVTGTRPGGVGDRVCVDLIQSLSPGQGMLVGSSAKLLALVHAETFETGFVPTRPFRVNAGPVHAYALMANGSTKYLSELRAGDQVLVVNHKGQSRPVAIGRLKVEARPMIMVEIQGERGSKGQIFLQQAETVRLVSPTDTGAVENNEGWRPLPVTEIEGGEPLLLREVNRGTHVGRPIDAAVDES